MLIVNLLPLSLLEITGLIGAGNNPMVGMTVAVAVAIEEACK
ncbi:MAG: GGGtGRT protein [Clostridia bacterium]|nr:GGGtGRT protein [Clostridia bacterium]